MFTFVAGLVSCWMACVSCKQTSQAGELPDIEYNLLDYENLPWTVERTFVINLLRSEDRAENMRDQLNFMKIPFEFINAVDGKEIKKRYVQARNEANISDIVNEDRIPQDLHAYDPQNKTTIDIWDFGALACGMSHLKAYLRIIDYVNSAEGQNGPFLILEDDVAFDIKFKFVVPVYLNHVYRFDPTWDIFAIGYCGSGNPMPGYENDGYVSRSLGFACLHAYILRNAAAAKKIYDATIMHEEIIRIDEDLGWARYAKSLQIRAFIVFDNDIVVQNRSMFGSEIAGSDPIPQPAINRIPFEWLRG